MNVNKFVVFVKKNFNVIFGILIVLMTTILVSARFVALPYNLIWSDEGWYLCLLRDCPRFGSTRYFLLFHNLFNNNIYVIRLTCLIIQLLASAFMAFGMVFWLQKCYGKIGANYLFVILLCSILLTQGIEACPSFNYINLNKICVEFSVGFMFIGLAKRNPIYYCLSGFAIAFLFPVMITNTVIIPIILIVILLHSQNKKKDALSFCLGILLFIVYYCIFVESPKEIWSFFEANTKEVVRRGEEDYGVLFLLNWTKQTLLYLTRLFIISVLLYGIYWLLIKRAVLGLNRKMTIVVYGITSAVILFYLLRYLPPELPFAQVGRGDFCWIFLFLLLLFEIIGNKKVDTSALVVSAFLLLVPAALCFGSNTPFYLRGQDYFAFIYPLLMLYAFKRGIIWKMVLSLFLVFSFALFLISLSGENWHGDKLFGDHVSLKSIGIEQNVKLPQRYIEELVDCRSRIPKGKILCDFDNWGLVCLLN